MAFSKLSKDKFFRVKKMIEEGLSQRDIEEKTGVRRVIISEISKGTRVFCETCEDIHKGPICKTPSELKKHYDETYEACAVCGKEHKSEPCPDIKEEFKLLSGNTDQRIYYKR